MVTNNAINGGVRTVAGSTGSTLGPTLTIAGQDGISTSVTGTTLTITPRGVGTHNMFLGQGSGNLTVGFGENVGYGAATMPNLASASNNTAIGSQAMNAMDNFSNNTAVGTLSMFAQKGDRNTAVGSYALGGNGAGPITGDNNVAIGYSCIANGNSGGQNVAVGRSCLNLETTGTSNTVLGDNILSNTTGASYNIAIGLNAANSYTTTESSNILIGNAGVIAESNKIRIGTTGSGSAQQNMCFIAGINGVTVTGTAVLCSTAGQLGTVASSIRYKENVQDLQSQAEALHKLRPVQFNYIQDEAKLLQLGLIAEEVATDFPYLCFYNDQGAPESVKYHELPVILLQEVQALRKEVNDLKAKLSKIS
jgi:hypothetical protein